MNYITQTERVNEDKNIESDCNSLTFWNYGESPVQINKDVRLIKDALWAIDANLGENLVQNFYINFTDLGATKDLLVIRKIYTNG